MRRLLQCLLVGMLIYWGPAGADEADVMPPEARIPWTTSQIQGSPEPPAPYRVERAFPQLTFERPTVVTNWPLDDRLLVAEQGGKIFSFLNESPSADHDLFVDMKKLHSDVSAVYGLTFHPQVQEK